jgi:hypothetical protein
MSDKDFYADESKYQRIESLKNQLQCPCCSSFESDVIEAFHDGLDINAELADGQTRSHSTLLSKTSMANLNFASRSDHD